MNSQIPNPKSPLSKGTAKNAKGAQGGSPHAQIAETAETGPGGRTMVGSWELGVGSLRCLRGLVFSLCSVVLLCGAQQGQQRKTVTLREALGQAKSAAAKWQPDAFLQQLTFRPLDENAWRTGKNAEWQFAFASRSKSLPGCLICRQVSVATETIESPRKGGFDVQLSDLDIPTEPPWQAGLGEDFADTTSLYRSIEKAGVKNPQAIMLIELVNDHGRVLWRITMREELIYLDARTGALVGKGKLLKREEAALPAARDALADFEAKLRAEAARWKESKDAHDVKVQEMKATALDAGAFVKSLRVDFVEFGVGIGRKYLIAEVVGPHVYWRSMEKGKEAPAGSVKRLEVDKLNKALSERADLGPWLEAHKGATATVRLNAPKELLVIFALEKEVLQLNYDMESGTLK